LYDTSYDPGSRRILDGYHHSDDWTGTAWLTSGDKSAVIFVGTKGRGDCWYGYYDGTRWPNASGTEGPGDRGFWSERFEGVFLFYDPSDFAEVAEGSMGTWEPQPYATLVIDEHLFHIDYPQTQRRTGGVTYDRERNMIYMFEPFGDGAAPVVHVWHVEG